MSKDDPYTRVELSNGLQLSITDPAQHWAFPFVIKHENEYNTRLSLSQRDADQINKRRDDSKKHFADNTGDAPGWIAHIGNTARGGALVPLVVVQVWPDDLVNGQAILDGNDSLWVTAVKQGHMPGQWTWPERTDEAKSA